MSDRRRSVPPPRALSLSVVVPVFNEESRIIENLALLVDEVESAFADFEILVVSDGSTDQTNLKVFSFKHPQVSLHVLEDNHGKGFAVRAGFQRARGELVLFIDGGMELHPREIRLFVGLMDLYHADIVVGSKRHPQSRVNYPWYRRLLSWIFQRLVHAVFKINVTDTQVGIKLFRREVLERVLPHLEINRYGFDLEILSLAQMMGYGRILEAPVRMDYFLQRDSGTLADLAHVLRVGFSLLKDTIALARRLKALRWTAPSARSRHAA